MMNQYYGFSGRGGRCRSDFDRAPYRRPLNRNGIPGNMPGNMPGCTSNRTIDAPTNHAPCPGGNSNMPRPSGCGCGMNGAHHHDHGHDGRERAIPIGSRGNGCGCESRSGADTATCKRLMDQIRAVDFALYETVLYLDVYPHSCDALETYHKLKAQSEALRAEYEATCAPLTAFGNKSDTSWDWMGKPFPWEYDAD